MPGTAMSRTGHRAAARVAASSSMTATNRLTDMECIGHNLPHQALQAFAKTLVEVDGY
jgi:hypothetical protein